ncbi:phospholipid phosphatase 3 [Helicoverpa armigera]|uniref:phospholipid phosphatase 3 n=1 Tax=Helicoverpa armigera TaxID=29058 RepID=UPI003082B38C
MDKIKLLWSKTNRWHRGFFVFLLVELRVFPERQLGFQCNDPALSHPFTGDTISWKLLLATTVILPLVVMLLVERKYHNDKSGKSKQAMFWFKEYLFGLLVNLGTVQTLKLLVGSPRPHFFDTCSPKEALTCQGTEYVPKYTCTKAHWISQSDKSFPSGHTSLAVHTAIFLAYYLYRRTITRSNKILLLQVVLLLSAAVCSVSRMWDHRHHWWDVLAGATIAIPVLLYTIYSLCDNFNCKMAAVDCPSKEESDVVDTPLVSPKET